MVDQIGHGATVGEVGATPAGDIVIAAVPYTGAVDAVAHFGDALAGKNLVDISNTFNANASGLVTAPDSSAAQEIAAAARDCTRVVKALNTVFGHVLAHDTPLDVVYASDDTAAKAEVAAFLESKAGSIEAVRFAGNRTANNSSVDPARFPDVPTTRIARQSRPLPRLDSNQ